jgi:hypothetical protein
MSDATIPRIKSVEARPNYRLALSFDHGPRLIVDLSTYINKGGVFSPLSDEKLFSNVMIGELRRVITWPEPKDQYGYPAIDIDVESLISIAMQQRANSQVSDLLNLVRSLEKNIPRN